MALTDLQRAVCRLLAKQRIRSGESYVAGGARLSRDIDLFHDTEEAVEATWTADRALLEGSGYAVHVVRQRPGYVEAEVSANDEAVRMEWARDSSYRFFPLVEHPDLAQALDREEVRFRSGSIGGALPTIRPR